MRDDYDDLCPTDPIANELHSESIACQCDVNESIEFAKRLRARIELDHQVDLKTNVSVQTINKRNRKAQFKWLIGMSVAATLVLLASLARSSGPNAETIRHKIVEAPQLDIHVANRLPKADAERGLQLVNVSLGQTVRSVDDARTLVRGFLRPLNFANLDRANRPTESQLSKGRQANSPFFSTDEQLVASLTEKVLGICN